MTYTRATMKDYTLNGQTVRTDSLDGVGVRIGVKVGAERQRYNVWARADLLPRFGGKARVTVSEAGFNSVALEEKGHAMGAGLGVGGTRQLDANWRVTGSTFVTKHVGVKPAVRASVTLERAF